MSGTYPEPLQQIDRTYVLWRGRKLSYFAGCDYLRLASHPAVLNAARVGRARARIISEHPGETVLVHGDYDVDGICSTRRPQKKEPGGRRPG